MTEDYVFVQICLRDHEVIVFLHFLQPRIREEWWWKNDRWTDEGKHKQTITIFGMSKSSIHNTNNIYEEEAVLLFYK